MSGFAFSFYRLQEKYRSVATFCNKIAFYGFQSFVTSFLFTSQNDIIDRYICYKTEHALQYNV